MSHEVLTQALAPQSTYLYRVPQCMSPRRNWDSPTPSLASECPPTPNQRGGTHTRLRARGWGSPNSDDWRKSLALCLLCDLPESKSPSQPMRSKARGLVQHGGPPGWLEKSDPAGVILSVMDRPNFLPLPYRTNCPYRGCPSACWRNVQILLYSTCIHYTIICHELCHTRKAWTGTLEDPYILSGWATVFPIQVSHSHHPSTSSGL